MVLEEIRYSGFLFKEVGDNRRCVYYNVIVEFDERKCVYFLIRRKKDLVVFCYFFIFIVNEFCFVIGLSYSVWRGE